MLQSLISGAMKLFTRWDVLVEEMGQTYLAEPDTDGENARTLRLLQDSTVVVVRLTLEPPTVRGQRW